MASETWVQGIVHKLEEGGWVKWVRRAVVVAFCAFIINLWMFRDNGFKGLSQAHAMDQAQIAREIARGHGFTTKLIRPAALWQFEQNTGVFNVERTPDTYHAPLNPLINAPFLWLARAHWVMTKDDIVYTCDRIIVAVQFGFMLLGVLVSYLTIKRLFDQRVAVLSAWLLLVCETLWDFAVSGLPQNVMVFLFACAAYALVRALEARAAGTRTWLWLSACGAAFGLLALAHGLTIWIFAGAATFALLVFKPRWQTALALIGAFTILYAPWLVRMKRACNNPAGVAWFTYLHQIRGSEGSIHRSMEPPLKDVSPWLFREKIQGQVVSQLERLYYFLGRIAVAPVFFIALMHLFKRPETAAFRWAILLMWLAALLGMSLTGMGEAPLFAPFAPRVQANDLHILFAPMMTAYGLAFTLVMWSRLGINVRLVRFGFIAAIFLISGAPFLFQFIDLNSRPKGRVQWPPYVPPFIAILNTWTTEGEVIASDMPWAVAWYADRKSLWLPTTVKNFTDLNDYNQLQGRIVGLYLTPVTANDPFMLDIVKGEWKDWAAFIMRQVSGAGLKDFPLKTFTPLPIDGECIYYSDRDRWSSRED